MYMLRESCCSAWQYAGLGGRASAGLARTRFGGVRHSPSAQIERGAGASPAVPFELAFDTVKRAERTLGHDKGNPELTYLQYDYLAGK